MAVLVKNYKHGSLTLDLYVKVGRVFGGKNEGWGCVFKSYPTKADADSGEGQLKEFNSYSTAPYVEGEHPFTAVYNQYKTDMQANGFVVQDV